MQAARGTTITSTSPARRRGATATIAAVALAGYGLDRLTKHLALGHLDPTRPASHLGGLVKLHLISNPGAAFSMGSSVTVVFSLLSAVALVAVLVLAVPRVRSMGAAWATGLALAGIAGNLTDRLLRPPGVLRGEVVDFVQLPHFAIFNVADMCITATAVLLVATTLLRREHVEHEEHGTDARDAVDHGADEHVAPVATSTGRAEPTPEEDR